MADSEALELTKRLERVERDLRRYRVALVALGLVVLTAAGLNAVRPAGASGTPAVIQARKFQLVDRAGRVRAGLGMAGDDVGLEFLDKAGRVRAGLTMAGDHVGLEFFDKAGRVRAGLGMFGDNVALDFFDKAGRVRAGLTMAGDHVG
jgi:hypothetical protein